MFSLRCDRACAQLFTIFLFHSTFLTNSAKCGWDCWRNPGPDQGCLPSLMNAESFVEAHCRRCAHPGARSSIAVLRGIGAEAERREASADYAAEKLRPR